MQRIITLSFIVLFAYTAHDAHAQSIRLSRFIQPTDTVEEGGVLLPVSSDDAEQENDAIDALFDDDIDAGWEGEPQDQNILTCGLRFRDLYIPRGAIIDSAYIRVNSHESKLAIDVANLTIQCEATDHAETFTEDALIDARPRGNASVRWVVDVPWGLWTYHNTPDLSAIIQEVVDRDGWEAGNAISFIILGEDQGPSEVENAREFESFENIADPEDGGDGTNHPERVPELIVYYSVQSALVDIPIIATDTVEEGGALLPVSSDDAEQENDEIDALFDDDIDVGWEGEPQDQNILTAGLRFQHVGVPRGAVIDSAFIVVYSHEIKTADDVANITIVGEATDHAETFTEDALIDARPRTDAQIRWVVDIPWGLWTEHKTVDIKDIVQELVDRDGWEPGNAMAFVLLGEDQGPSEVENAREFESYENIADPEDGGDGTNHPERRPRLQVYYSSPNNATSIEDVLVDEVEALKVFPNPASDYVTIDLEGSEEATITVFDMNGRVVMNLVNTYGSRVQLSTRALVPGSYFITAIQKGTRYAQRLIIK